MKEDGQQRIHGNVRSAIDKERTKIRERQRRSITSKIFHGLRRHGGYRLSPRADINQVLRHLAQEAGWVVEPDGTTYRSNSTTTALTVSYAIGVCPLCGGGRKGGTPMPTNSFKRESATTALPHRITTRDATTLHHSSLYGGGGPSYSCSSNTPIPTSCLPHSHDTEMAIDTFNAMMEKASAAASVVHQKIELLPEIQASSQNTLNTSVDPPQYLH